MSVDYYLGLHDDLRDYMRRLVNGKAKPALELTGLDHDTAEHQPVVEQMLQEIRERNSIKPPGPRVTPGLANLLNPEEGQ